MRQTFLDRALCTAAAALAIIYVGCTQDFGQFEPDDSGSGAIGTGAASSGGNGNEGPGGFSSSSSSSSAQGGSGTCTTAAECDDSNPCTTDSCTANACAYEAVADGPISGGMDLPTDCVDSVCQAGAAVVVPDDAEVPDDANACTQDACGDGNATHTPAGEGTPCAAGVCNATGQCVGCVEDADCGEGTFCQSFNCNSGVCEVDFTSNNQQLPDAQQVVGDCQELRCDGSGGVKSVTDNGDEPLDDGNQCTNEACSQGTPVHPPKQAGVSCNGGVCNGGGVCVECVDSGDCSGSEICTNNMCTCPITCQTLGLTCGTTTACGQTINCNDGIKNGSETDVDCGGAAGCSVKCALGKTCTSGFNCTSNQCADGVCCNTSCTGTCFACNLAASKGTCSAVPKFSDDIPVCSGTLTCDGAGGCKKENGQSCGGGAECASGVCTGGVCV